MSKPRCPYCHDDIRTRQEGVRCARCGTAHHKLCFEEHGKCSVMGCDAIESRRMTTLETARAMIQVGRNAMTGALENARERLGGKTTVGLFSLSILVTGLGATPLLYWKHASPRVDIEVLLGGLFLILAAWITALLYRGAQLEDDMTLRPMQKSPEEYGWGRGWKGNSLDGCDLGGCGGGGSDLEGILILIVGIIALIVLIFVILPLVAWLAVEVVFPIIVLGTYGALYGALAFAVNARSSLKGRLGACLVRGIGYAALYTGVVAIVLGMGIRAYHAYAPVLPH